MSDEQTSNEETLKRWTTKRRSALVLEILRGDTTVAEAARKHALTVAEIEQWKERWPSSMTNVWFDRWVALQERFALR